MNSTRFRAGALVGGVSALALSAGIAHAQSAAANKVAELDAAGAYLSGDKHNHTTCTDGATSVQTLVNQSVLTYGLDWFAQTGHGGSGNRDCRFDDNPGFFPSTGDEVRPSGAATSNFGGNAFGGDDDDVLWVDTIGEDGLRGDDNGDRMWRWQMLDEFAYPLQRDAGRILNKPVWLGIEHVVPGHEHVSMAIITDQLNEGVGDNPEGRFATAQFEYLFDRADSDLSGGEDNDFENPANNGVPKDAEATTGLAGHQRAVRSVEWLRENYPLRSYYVPAHVERQGAFTTTGADGWNVEHFRNLHTAGLIEPGVITSKSLVMGAEMIAGHQFENGGRGTYEMDRPTAGFGTYGGAGAYSAAEVTVPGTDFDGTPLTNARLTEIREEFNALFDGQFTEPSGSDAYDELDACSDCADPAPEGVGTSPQERFVLGRPGIRTMWDALLGEGRRFFNYGSSDWHNRDIFAPFEPQSTLDPWPGEYNKIYAYAEDVQGDGFNFQQVDAQQILLGMRRGNTYSVLGDLIDEFRFVMCQADRCATMGERLIVTPTDGPVTWLIQLRDPEGANFSPYTFENMSLAQIGVSVPTNEPILSHVDVIRGDVTSGLISPDDPAYTQNVSNPTVELFARIGNPEHPAAPAGDLEFREVTDDRLAGEGFIFATAEIPVSTITNDMYFRVRGTNLPPNTPNETDADGNPLLDDFALLIACTAVDPEPDGTFKPEFCPEHLPIDGEGNFRLDADVEAWTDLWFYANPIFIDFRG